MRKVVQLKTGMLEIEVRNSTIPLDDLCGFASRNNPKRGYLFVSKVLGKHYPVKPSVMRNIYSILGRSIATIDMDGPVVAVGMAETAIGFGQGVFESLRLLQPDKESLFIHTTRYNFDRRRALRFEEYHCHAPEHILYEPCGHDEKTIFYSATTLILLDDEISTGNTFVNLVTSFCNQNPNLQQVLLVTITNWIDDSKRLELIRQMPCAVHFVSILDGGFTFIPDKGFRFSSKYKSVGNGEMKDGCLKVNFGRFGCRNTPQVDLHGRIDDLRLSMEDRILVLGTGEFTYLPFKLAELLEEKGHNVFFQSTTRSPIIVDCDIQCKIVFQDNYFDGIDNFVYNVCSEDYTRIILCYETCILPVEHDLIERLGAHPVFFG